MSAWTPTDAVSGARPFPVCLTPALEMGLSLGPGAWISHCRGNKQEPFTLCREPKGREATSFSHEADKGDTRDCGWRACSEGTTGYPGCLAVNHAAQASEHRAGWLGARCLGVGGQGQQIQEVGCMSQRSPGPDGSPVLPRWGN